MIAKSCPVHVFWDLFSARRTLPIGRKQTTVGSIFSHGRQGSVENTPLLYMRDRYERRPPISFLCHDSAPVLGTSDAQRGSVTAAPWNSP